MTNRSPDQRTETRRLRSVDPLVVSQRAVEPVPEEAPRLQDLAAALEAAQREIITLKVGLERRTVIGEAIGITMTRAGITADAAFAHLVELSQDTNLKVRDLAQRIVDEADHQADDARRGLRPLE